MKALHTCPIYIVLNKMSWAGVVGQNLSSHHKHLSHGGDISWRRLDSMLPDPKLDLQVMWHHLTAPQAFVLCIALNKELSWVGTETKSASDNSKWNLSDQRTLLKQPGIQAMWCHVTALQFCVLCMLHWLKSRVELGVGQNLSQSPQRNNSVDMLYWLQNTAQFKKGNNFGIVWRKNDWHWEACPKLSQPSSWANKRYHPLGMLASCTVPGPSQLQLHSDVRVRSKTLTPNGAAWWRVFTFLEWAPPHPTQTESLEKQLCWITQTVSRPPGILAGSAVDHRWAQCTIPSPC